MCFLFYIYLFVIYVVIREDVIGYKWIGHFDKAKLYWQLHFIERIMFSHYSVCYR